jgi:hypothetical protein
MRVADDWGGVQGPRDGHGLPRADEGGYACAPPAGCAAAFGCLLRLGARCASGWRGAARHRAKGLTGTALMD